MNKDKLNDLIKELPSSCQSFLNYLRAENKSHNTIVNYALDLKSWIRFQFPEQEVTTSDLEGVKLEDLYNFIGELSNTKASASIARMCGAIKSFYRYLDKFKMIKTNPSIDLSSPQIKKRLPKYLVEDDMIELMNAMRSNQNRCDSPERDYAIILTFLSTGVRLSELVNMELNDINGDGSLTVIGKGDKDREIPLSESCQKAITDYLQVRSSNSKKLFVNKLGNKFTPNGVQKLVKFYLKMIGKEELSTHKLRHSAISNMLQNGTDLRTLQEIAGHASLMTTQIYTHVNNQNKRDAVNNTALAKL